ncbi:MAG: helix-turn-helix domain-containing protein [Pontiellaceae bacterium]|nr:helix-turn-helix domain-containing protein [Pontiellaceae bacterium]MBN2785921.1 helix-turn-helix domain-containing protein [Pontiellaceae bacterium]
MNLNDHELKRVMRVCERIHCIHPNEPFSNHLYVVLSGLLPCVHLTIDRVSLKTFELLEMVTETLPPDLLQLATPFMHEHPAMKQAAAPQGPQLGTILTQMNRADFRRTGLYNESMKDFSVEDQLWMSLRCDDETTGVVFCRDTPFSEKEQFIASLVHPHINIAWRNRQRLRQLEEQLQNAINASTPIPSPFTSLSIRQRQIAERVASGMSNREVAATLGISPRTVSKHLEQIFAITGIHSRTLLAAQWNQANVASGDLHPDHPQKH